jgi:hypothetical protein
MQKQFVTITIFLFLLTISLTGCTQPTSEKNKFVGTWITQVKTNPMDDSNYTDTVTFFANGSYETTSLGIGHIPGRWDLQNGKLLIDTYYPGTYQYSFSKNNTILTLTSVSGGDIETLTKQK